MIRQRPSRISAEALVFPAALVLGILAFGVFAWSSRPWLPIGDQAMLADIARHVAAGDGIVSSSSFPVFLSASPGLPVDRGTAFIAPPGLLLLFGAAFKIGGVSETSIVLLQGLLFTGLLILTYVVGRRFLDPAAAALAVALLGVGSTQLLRQAVTFWWTDLPFAVATMGIVALIVYAPAARASYSLAAAGVLLGVSQLVRENAGSFGLAFAALIVAHSAGPNALRRVATFAGAWAVSVALIVVFSSEASTRTSFLAMALLVETPSYPGWTIYGEIRPPTLGTVIQHHLLEIAAKGLAGMRFYLHDLVNIANPLISGGVVLSGLLLVREPRARPLIVFVTVATVMTVAIVSIISFEIRFFLFVLPSYILLVVWALRHHARDLRLGGTILLGLALVVFAGETVRLARDVDDRVAFMSEFNTLTRAVRESSFPGDWVATDLPHEIAWYSGVPAVHLPNRVEDLPELARLRRQVTRIVLTNVQVTSTARQFPDKTWLRVLEGETLPGYEVESRFEGPHLTAVILRAR